MKQLIESGQSHYVRRMLGAEVSKHLRSNKARKKVYLYNPGYDVEGYRSLLTEETRQELLRREK